jgi:DNA-binding NarL/FixJ family response regulator
MNKSSSSPVTSATILIVEDNDIYRQVVCAALQNQFPGWQVIPAANLEAARNVIATNSLDVLITDLSLPDGSGVDLLPVLGPALAKGLRLIALTNDSAADVLVGLKRLGYHGFVAKEHGIKALCNAVHVVAGGEEFVSEPL